MAEESEPSVPDALRPAIDAIDDAHAQWHDAFDSYHDPDDFRRHVEAVIQSLRNVTFRIQAAKAGLPGDFDAWYLGVWQPFMRDDASMAWLSATRTDVVHKVGLNPESRAIVRIIDSYLEPTTTLLALPARTPTSGIVQRARGRIPENFRPHVAIEVTRRWDIAELGHAEFLMTLAHCFAVLDALLTYIANLVNGSDPDSLTTPVDPLHPWPCMVPDPSRFPLIIEADTGDIYEAEFTPFEPTIDPAEAGARYRSLPEWPTGSEPIVDRARAMHETARAVFRKDGYHVPLLFLFGTDSAQLVVMESENKRDKFMQWHRLGALARRGAFDSFIFTSETWMAPLRKDIAPYPDLASDPDRKEALATHYAEASGDAGSFMSEIHRLLGRPFIKKPYHNALEVDSFVRPVFAAWAERA